MLVLIGKIWLHAPGILFFKRAVIAALSVDYGIRAKWLKSRSDNIAENAIYSRDPLKRSGVNRVILVTHAWHIKRAEAALAANGLVVRGASIAFYHPGRYGLLNDFTPSLGTLRLSGYAAHEIVGSMWYALKYGY
jgi:uncharacterized SAM-binding protein YcdF (DUF218 family)